MSGRTLRIEQRNSGKRVLLGRNHGVRSWMEFRDTAEDTPGSHWGQAMSYNFASRIHIQRTPPSATPLSLKHRVALPLRLEVNKALLHALASGASSHPTA